jgi:hypothetical protein
MAKEVLYRQCVLEKPSTTGGTIQTTTWIPERHQGHQIEAGIRVTLKDPRTKEDLEGVWDVKSVGSMTRTSTEASFQAQAWKHWRGVTDV